ncbi:hypothetical protein ACHAXH_008236 [Discostella pseudostelligera]
MLPLGFAAVVAGLVIIVNFDGSLRLPRDPVPGFRHNSGKEMASCSATVSFQLPNHEEASFAIGGKLLPIVPGITSADAEYEGLLLGLNWLASAYNPNNCDRTELNRNVLSDATKIIIRGDCKAVIDQLNSKSSPRKMETHYNTAQTYIRDIQKSSFDKSSRELSVVCELIPRDENCLCDAICKLVTTQKLLDEVSKIDRLIISDDLELALDELLRNTSLCHSSRYYLSLKLAQELIYLARMGKWENAGTYASILDELSGYYMDLSRQYSKIYWNPEDDDDDDVVNEKKQELKEVSIACRDLSRHYKIDASSRGCLRIDQSNYFVDNYSGLVSNLFDPYNENISDIVKSCSPTKSRRGQLKRWREKVLVRSKANNVSSGQDLWVLESQEVKTLSAN